MVEARGVEPLFLKWMFLMFACVYFETLTQVQTVLDIGKQGYL